MSYKSLFYYTYPVKDQIKLPLTIALLINFSIITLSAQTMQQKYNLNFENVSKCNRNWLSSGNTLYLNDTTSMYKGKAPFKLHYNKFAREKNMQFNLSQIIILPNHSEKSECQISISSKDKLPNDVLFKLTAYDKDELEIASELTTINSKQWRTHSLTLPLLNAKAIRVSISYSGNSSPEQCIWLDRLAIKIDKKTINNYNYLQALSSEDELFSNKLENRHAVALQLHNDSTMLKDVYGIQNKKIIGLGESTHGSSSLQIANYQIIKNLILNQNCKLVLLEMPIDNTLIMDLYVQGKLPSSYQDAIIPFLKPSIGGYKNTIQFLNWLRSYNLSAETKVHIFGIDNSIYLPINFFEFQLAVFGEQASQPHLSAINNGQYETALKQAEQDSTLANQLGTKSFKLYLQIIRDEIRQINDPSNRDINMFKKVEFLTNLYLEHNQTAVVYAHSGHITTQPEIDTFINADKPLGYYLKNIHKEKYFTISAQIGTGTYSQDECSINGKVISVSLPPPPSYSFEYSALAYGSNFFFYPSSFLPENLLSHGKISRASLNSDLFRFASLKRRFDAYIFLRESEAIEEVEENIMLYNMNFFESKRQQIDKFINKRP